jgi:prepilin-type N-terminal cleavage/methylation domain-containing protein
MPRSHPRARPAFSLVELVIVVVIIGILGAIALPRVTSAGDRARASALQASIAELQKSVDHYSAEHLERSPATEPDGSTSIAGLAIARRLMRRTDDFGVVSAAGVYGPYIRTWPLNPYNDLATIRIDGAAAGANTHGWRYDSASSRIEADHKVTSGVAIVTKPAGGGQPVEAQLPIGP